MTSSALDRTKAILTEELMMLDVRGAVLDSVAERLGALNETLKAALGSSNHSNAVSGLIWVNAALNFLGFAKTETAVAVVKIQARIAEL